MGSGGDGGKGRRRVGGIESIGGEDGQREGVGRERARDSGDGGGRERERELRGEYECKMELES